MPSFPSSARRFVAPTFLASLPSIGRLAVFGFAVALVLGPASELHAQVATGTILGNVKDNTGAGGARELRSRRRTSARRFRARR